MLLFLHGLSERSRLLFDCLDACQNHTGCCVHHNTVVNDLVNHKDDLRHVLDKRLSLKLALENLIEALVDAIQNLAKDELVVVSMTQNVYRHVAVAAED